MSTVSTFHALLSGAAFFSALVVGCFLHYKKIVKNDVAGWPEEWFPSVSATIGDWYPERNIFQLLIAINSGPRFILIAFGYLLNRQMFPLSTLPGFLSVVGVLRTLTCGGWVYITSSDNHDVHDVLMILYIVLNLPWMFGNIRLSRGRARRQRIRVAYLFWLSLLPMIYFFVQHKVYRVPGAYTRYAFFEWSLILFDILYDSVAIIDLGESGMASLAFEIDIDIRYVQDPTAARDEMYQLPRSLKLVQKCNHFGLIDLFVTYRPLLSFMSDLYFGTPLLYAAPTEFDFAVISPSAYQAWTLLTGLPVTLFYFSIWKLALAGPEFSALATLSPLLLGFAPVRSFANSRAGRTALAGTAGVFGLGLWWVESMWIRLGAAIIGVFCTGIRWAAEWQADIGNGYHSVLFVLGFILSSLSKHLNHGNNPAWLIVDVASGRHVLILVLGFFALVEFATRPESNFPASLAPTPSTSSQPSAKSSKADNAPDPTPREPWLFSSIALGALMCSLHERLSDPSTLLAWSWSGLPTAGPHPHIHAPLTLLVQVLATLLALALSPPSPPTGSCTSSGLQKIPAHPLTFAIGVLSTYLLHTRTGWIGYAGGLVHAAFLTVITPLVLQNAGAAARSRGAGRVFGLAWAVWTVFLFVTTFTVAYAFVPGAWSFRERTDLTARPPRAFFQLALLSQSPRPQRFGPSRHWLVAYIRASLALIAVAALVGPLRRSAPPTPVPVPAHARARILNAGIWAVHFGIDNAGRDSQRGMRDLFRDMDLDIVGLLETDLHRPVFGSRDLTRVAVEDLGYYVDFGPGPDKHTWGCVLLSKVVPYSQVPPPSLALPEGELAPAIEAVIDVYGMNVTVIVAHNGQEETPLDRELQATELARIIALFLFASGGAHMTPHFPTAAPYDIMVRDGRVHDIDKDDLDRWCEYIFYRGLHRTAYARISRGSITDTELQVGQFAVPRYRKTTAEVAEADRYLRAWKEELPEEHWFPDAYYGDEHSGGVRGHFYHVFNTPLYYKLPPEPAL
ncbi:Frag1/DRAM/Sfk1 family-domain-containing protein [Lactarius pseudohatsudake]|nr:Frag1/DRAM/Sfk1 family-domain-containing protein [Lactarius pseudohatsudake]